LSTSGYYSKRRHLFLEDAAEKSSSGGLKKSKNFQKMNLGFLMVPNKKITKISKMMD